MIILTIFNTIAIIYMLTHKQFSYDKNSTHKKTLLGYSFYYKNERFVYLPIRNTRKTELNEEIHNMINGNEQSKRQKLYAKFSWLKTIPEVEQFKKDYEIVDSELVNKLVEDFKFKNMKKNEICW